MPKYCFNQFSLSLTHDIIILFFNVRVGGKYLVRLNYMGLNKLGYMLEVPTQSRDNQQERSRLNRGILRDYTPSPDLIGEDIVRHS